MLRLELKREMEMELQEKETPFLLFSVGFFERFDAADHPTVVLVNMGNDCGG